MIELQRTEKDIKRAESWCTWVECDEGGVWETDCGNVFQLEAGTPKDNDMRFCPYCGERLIQ